ncbi:MAG TPA: hypothetical protein G4O10_08930 [Dehalococcoidia bacterium]|nr:hypothetical protein [Dehalococcoidia bacterium]
MRRIQTYILLACLFAAVSALSYLIHYLIFEDVHHIFIYMIGDFAFLPLEVFLVVIVIERILTRREKMTIREKLNMVVGAFFSEIGDQLLRNLLHCMQMNKEISQNLNIRPDWTRTNFKKAVNFARNLHYEPDCQELDLERLRATLVGKRQFLLTLLENPNILEHERFTDLLWATFHLTEELEARASLDDLPESDIGHIAIDIERLFSLLIVEWVDYAEHLQSNYPYLFSLMTRIHPFQETPSAVVRA